jgi:hypothetical protein
MADSYRQAGVYQAGVYTDLKGEKPADPPVQAATP